MKHYEFVIQTLKQNYPFDEETLNRYMSDQGRRHSKDLVACIIDALGEYGGKTSSGVLDEKLIIGMIDGMNEYIRTYRSIPAFKQKVWNSFRDWIMCIADRYDIQNAEKLIEEIMERPVEDDTAVAVVKLLHAEKVEDGKTKDEMVEALSVNEKTIRNTLHLLDPDFDKDPKAKARESKKRNTPRFGGQLMQVGIKYMEEEKKERRFYSPETLHPVAMQLNVYQVGTLLKSLQLAYDTEISYNSVNMAINVWSQLTDYCKERITDFVRPDDEDLRSFLELIDDMESGQPFVTEKEIFDDELIENKLNLAFKGGYRCSVKLKDKILRGCRIKYDCTKYYIHHEGNVYEAFPGDIEDILLIED